MLAGRKLEGKEGTLLKTKNLRAACGAIESVQRFPASRRKP